MDSFTKENISNYTNDLDSKNDHKYLEKMLKIRKELHQLDQNTRKDDGVIDCNRMLNDFM